MVLNPLACVGNVLVLEEFPYDLSLPLSGARVRMNAGYQLGEVAGANLSKTIRVGAWFSCSSELRSGQ